MFTAARDMAADFTTEKEREGKGEGGRGYLSDDSRVQYMV